MSAEPSLTAAAYFLIVFAVATIRMFQLLRNIRRARTHPQSYFSTTRHAVPIKTLVVLGSGGHTTEMLSLLQALDSTRYSPIVFCKASSDSTSLQRLQHSDKFKCYGATSVYDIPRAREVGQNYFTSIFTTLYAQLHALWLVFCLRPQLVLCNGPGTCLPVCLAALLFRFLGIMRVELVFCESLCRVQSLSMTGKLLYHVADVFLVHWPELLAKYPRSRRIQVFVKDD